MLNNQLDLVGRGHGEAHVEGLKQHWADKAFVVESQKHSGNDMLYGGEGADELRGGEGNDKPYGGEGADTFIFDMGAGWSNRVKEFEEGVDSIIFEGVDNVRVCQSRSDIAVRALGNRANLPRSSRLQRKLAPTFGRRRDGAALTIPFKLRELRSAGTCHACTQIETAKLDRVDPQ
ncbi:MAG: hypothetical protein AAGD13_08885 [Pseudomonadota bacterium]